MSPMYSNGGKLSKYHLKGKILRKWANGLKIYDFEKKKMDPRSWSAPTPGQYTCYLTGCPVLLFFLFFPIFSGLPIFSYILIPNPIFFHQIPIFFKMLQIIMKYQGKIMEFWFEMPVLMSLAFIFFLARFACS